MADDQCPVIVSRYRKRMNNMTQEERVAHLQRQRLRMRTYRLNMSEEQRIIQANRDRLRRKERWERLGGEQRSMQLERRRAKYRNHLENLSDEQRSLLRERKRISERNRRSAMQLHKQHPQHSVEQQLLPVKSSNIITSSKKSRPPALNVMPLVHGTSTIKSATSTSGPATLNNSDSENDHFLQVMEQHLNSETSRLNGQNIGGSLRILNNSLEVSLCRNGSSTLSFNSKPDLESNAEVDLNIHDGDEVNYSDDDIGNDIKNNVACTSSAVSDVVEDIPRQCSEYVSTSTNRQCSNHNCARNYTDSSRLQTFQLSNPRSCQHCHAKLFDHETEEMCCLKGKVSLPMPPIPQDLLDLYTTSSDEGKHFRQHIRAYNHVHAFTSMGVHVDESLATGRNGVYTYRARGSIYHRIGDLLPRPGQRPRYLQMYIYDTDHELDYRLAENDSLNRQVLAILKQTLDSCNPFVGILRQISRRDDLHNIRLHIKDHPDSLHQYSQPTSSQVAAILVGGEDPFDRNERDIIIETDHGRLIHVPDTAGFYDPLQYPLLHPYGTFGWDVNVFSSRLRKVSCRAFYSYMLQIRDTYESLLLRAGRLLQQYVVDNYVKISTQQLRYIRDHQRDIRAELYQGLQDAFSLGHTYTGNIGRRIILPASYIGSPRDMHERYHDAMAIVQKFGKPDLFITMTCNPNWQEIKRELENGQIASDRPDVTTRIFHSKCEELKKDLFKKGVLGKVVAHVHVIEFQKRGLPHAHFLLILDQSDNLRNPEDYDQIVRAEIPDPNKEPELHSIVLRHMIHGPCGVLNPSCVCMKNDKCKKNFPKRFSSSTLQGDDSFPIYMRRNTEKYLLHTNNGQYHVDNQWVVPYNPWLLKKYDCHINVEICSSIKSVKYLYKYVYKGVDRVRFQVTSSEAGDNEDEIKQFMDGRWICPQEALWRIFKFPLNRMYPSVYALQIHLPNMHRVTYHEGESLTKLLDDSNTSRTMLTEFFNLNKVDEEARQYLYQEIPGHYTWIKSKKCWQKRRGRNQVIGRIYTVSPSDSENYYLRILLNHVRGPTSYESLRTVGSVTCATFKEVAEKLGLVEGGSDIRETLQEAVAIRMPHALRKLFVIILVHCKPPHVRDLWNEFHTYMMEDYTSSASTDPPIKLLLKDIRSALSEHGKKISDYDLPSISDKTTTVPVDTEFISEEQAVPVPPDDLSSVDKLNQDQRYAFNKIVNSVVNNVGRVYFVDGPGGTGKTFLYRSILAYLRNMGHIAIATATSGIAAIMMPGGRTTHSRFKIPIPTYAESTCNIVVVLGGDFRQTPPVIAHGARAEIIDACLSKSSLWEFVDVIRLRENMRARADPDFSDFLIRIGDGTEDYVIDDMIRVPDDMVIPWKDDHSLFSLIDSVFPKLHDNALDSSYMMQRAIITPTNDHVDRVNDEVIKLFPGEIFSSYSFDSVENDARQLYPMEFIHSICPGGLPPHKLNLKLGSPIILLRNIDPKNGLCNGTRMLCRGFFRKLIYAEIVTGSFCGKPVFIPRIPLSSSDDIKLPFVITKKQFPVRLSFALTINKSQGQTIPIVGIYLPNHVFSHGQLYVAMSRGVSRSTTKILVNNGTLRGFPGVHTRNVVYTELLSSCVA